MNYEIREIHQHGSGGSHLVVYQAALELLDDQNVVEVTVLNVGPELFEEPNSRELAAECIRRGAILALRGYGKGARINGNQYNASRWSVARH